MKDLIKRLEDRNANLSSSVLKINGTIVIMKKNIENSEKMLNEAIGRQKELNEMIIELKNMEKS